MNGINSFTFYFDYYNLIDTMPLEDKKALLVAITDYVFKDTEPVLEGHNQAIFNTLKAQLNVSKNNAKRRTEKETGSTTGKKPEAQPEENKTSILSFKFYISNLDFYKDRELLRGKIEEWLKYKNERKEKYTETGFKSLLTQIQKNCETYTEEQVESLIDESMANNWRGIIFDKLKNCKKQSTSQWLNQKIEKQAISSEEKQELDTMFDEFK